MLGSHAPTSSTLRTSTDPASFHKDFQARLMSLSATHTQLTATNWISADLREIVQLEFHPFGPERYRLDGPAVSLSPNRALALGLGWPGELATNAAKYGALASGFGKVEVVWRVQKQRPAPELTIDWTEQGGPPVAPPTRRGFGSRLIERSLGHLRGEARLNYAPDGRGLLHPPATAGRNEPGSNDTGEAEQPLPDRRAPDHR